MTDDSASAKSAYRTELFDVDPSERTVILLATHRRWLETALKEVLSPENFAVVLARDSDELHRIAERELPAMVIIDEELPGLTLRDAARSLTEGPLEPSTPLLMYTSSAIAHARGHAEAYRSGFWDVLTDPLRPSVLVAKLRRLLALSEEMRCPQRARPASHGDGQSFRFLTLDEVGKVLPAVGALAEREQMTISLILLGPTTSDFTDREKVRSMTAFLCGPNLRQADLCAWLDDAEVMIIAFDTNEREAQTLVERLNILASGRRKREPTEHQLSAAIVELEPSGSLKRAVHEIGPSGNGNSATLERIVELFHLSEARDALREAREEGGGVRVIDIA